MLPWAHPSPQPKRHLDRFSRFVQPTTECRWPWPVVCRFHGHLDPHRLRSLLHTRDHVLSAMSCVCARWSCTRPSCVFYSESSGTLQGGRQYRRRDLVSVHASHAHATPAITDDVTYTRPTNLAHHSATTYACPAH